MSWSPNIQTSLQSSYCSFFAAAVSTSQPMMKGFPKEVQLFSHIFIKLDLSYFIMNIHSGGPLKILKYRFSDQIPTIFSSSFDGGSFHHGSSQNGCRDGPSTRVWGIPKQMDKSFPVKIGLSFSVFLHRFRNNPITTQSFKGILTIQGNPWTGKRDRREISSPSEKHRHLLRTTADEWFMSLCG